VQKRGSMWFNVCERIIVGRCECALRCVSAYELVGLLSRLIIVSAHNHELTRLKTWGSDVSFSLSSNLRHAFLPSRRYPLRQ
jgi:hypothetical protein